MKQTSQKNRTRKTRQTGGYTPPHLLLAPLAFLDTWGLLFGALLITIGAILLLEYVSPDPNRNILVGSSIAVISLILIWATAERLAVWRYLVATRKEQKRKQRSLIYTPLAALQNVYETPVNFRAAGATQDQWDNITDLLQVEENHLLILGLPGAGKTMALEVCLEKILEERHGGKHRIPLLLLMREYNAYLSGHQYPLGANNIPEQTLLNYLECESQVPGIRFLRPYLRHLAQRGRLTFLCDGLNELSADMLPFVCQELMRIMDTSSNRLVMTCRELDYREQNTLHQLVGATYAAQALIAPVPLDKIDLFVNRYLQAPPEAGQEWNYDASEISTLIKRTSLHYDCANPFILVALIKTINGMRLEERRRMRSRGSLLAMYVFQALESELRKEQWAQASFTRDDVVLFLSKVACTARRARYRNAIQLGVATPSGGFLMDELAVRLLRWLEEPEAPGMQPLPTEQDLGLEVVHKPYDHPAVALFLNCAQNAGIITISQNGVLSFQHELIAEYFVANYLYTMHLKNPSTVPFGQEVFTEVGAWSEPVAIWAGLTENAVELAAHLANQEQQNFTSTYNVLVLSLICMGVTWKIDGSAPTTINFPVSILEMFRLYVGNAGARQKLAPIFQRCADEGGTEIYRALLPLLPLVEGVADLLLLLDQRTIIEILFDYLVEVADKASYKVQVDHLVVVIGRFGRNVLPQAERLCLDIPENNVHVRAAAMTILGRIGDGESIELMLAGLAAQNKVISHAAVNALIHLGPDLAALRVAAELVNTGPSPSRAQIHWGTLAVLKIFLSRPNLSPILHQRMVEAVGTALASNYTSQMQQEAKAILLNEVQGSTGSNPGRSHNVIMSLVGSLSTQDTPLADNSMNVLKQIGAPTTLYLQEALQTQTQELLRQRVVKVIGTIRAPQALPALINLLADPSEAVQQALITSLLQYAPESIDQLISVVLEEHASDRMREQAATILKIIGTATDVEMSDFIHETCVQSICQAIVHITPRGTPLLVQVLQHLGDKSAVPVLIELLRHGVAGNLVLASNIIAALGTLQDSRAVEPLLLVLEQTPALYSKTTEALSNLGEVALDGLLSRLDVKEESRVTRGIREALLLMRPFQAQRLLAAFRRPSDILAGHLIMVFHAKAADVITLLVDRLFDPDQRIQSYVRQMVEEMPGHLSIPPLIEALSRQGWAPVLADYLLKYSASIPYLIERLVDEERSQTAYEILLRFGKQTLPFLMCGLQGKTQPRTQELLAILARQSPPLLPHIIGLFDPARSPTCPSSEQARVALRDVLVHHLADICLPYLLQGLEQPILIDAVSETLKELALQEGDGVIQALFGVLHQSERRRGAEATLVKIGPPALQGLRQLIVHTDTSIAKSAQHILIELGVVAFPLIVAAYREGKHPQERSVARQIFMQMQTSAVASGLIHLLLSEEFLEVEMAVSLLLLRIEEAKHPQQQQEMFSALFAAMQKTPQRLRLLAPLLLLDEKKVSRKSVAAYLTAFLKTKPEHYRAIISLLPLLGNQAIEPLAQALENVPISSPMHRELTSALGLIARHHKIEEYVQRLASFHLEPTQTVLRDDPQRAVFLRAFGSLLASGAYGLRELMNLSHNSHTSIEQEFFKVLLGYRNEPEIERLEKLVTTLNRQNEENMYKIIQKEKELKQVKDFNKELERELEQTRQQLRNMLKPPQSGHQ